METRRSCGDHGGRSQAIGGFGEFRKIHKRNRKTHQQPRQKHPRRRQAIYAQTAQGTNSSSSQTRDYHAPASRSSRPATCPRTNPCHGGIQEGGCRSRRRCTGSCRSESRCQEIPEIEVSREKKSNQERGTINRSINRSKWLIRCEKNLLDR